MPDPLQERFEAEHARKADPRTPYAVDRARIIHSAAFRRLQGKTQIMGAGEGDYHRTRLTHSLEVAQIAYGILLHLDRTADETDPLPPRDLLEAACLAHDIGHPPYGHKGEEAMHSWAVEKGLCFEGNAQTLRVLTRLEKKHPRLGINPTRRLVLAVLKYPIPFSNYRASLRRKGEPLKCHYEEDSEVVDWALEVFSSADRKHFYPRTRGREKPTQKTLDCSIMDIADDIAYAIHDIEDIAARTIVPHRELADAFTTAVTNVGVSKSQAKEWADMFTGDARDRKKAVGTLVNRLVTDVKLAKVEGYTHPLLRWNARLSAPSNKLASALKELSKTLVIDRAPVAQLERRGHHLVTSVLGALDPPGKLIPKHAWEELKNPDEARGVLDYVAGMTDSYLDRVYSRLFVPGIGSSADEL